MPRGTLALDISRLQETYHYLLPGGGRSDDFRLLSDSVPPVFIDKFVIPRMFRHTYVLTLTLSASKVLQDASH